MDEKVKKDIWIKMDRWMLSAEQGPNQKLNNQMRKKKANRYKFSDTQI